MGAEAVKEALVGAPLERVVRRGDVEVEIFIDKPAVVGDVHRPQRDEGVAQGIISLFLGTQLPGLAGVDIDTERPVADGGRNV